MMTRSRIAVLVLFAALSLLLAGCLASDSTEGMQTTVLTADISPNSLYRQAADKIAAAEHLSVYIGTMKTTAMGNQTFTEASQQDLNYQTDENGSLQASMEETLRMGTYTVALSEAYTDGAGYLTVNGSSFTAPMTADEYTDRYTPAVLFDPTLYSDVQAVSYGDATGITFREPSAAEAWSIPINATFLDASGCAVLDSDSALAESTYTVTYSVGSATVSQTTHIVIRSAVQVTLPESADVYTTLEYLDAPRMLEKACGYLLQATQIQARSTEAIACQAFAISRTQTASLSLSGIDDTFSALLDMHVNQINQSRGGEVTVIQQTESFQNGTYSISSNGSAPTVNAAVDYESMRTYCQDLLVESILLPAYITAASLSETDSTYRITFHASEALAEVICADTCSTLYNDPTLLNTLASSYSTDIVECYLELDKYTGLPVASGLRYGGTHTIEGISYQLTSQINQTYQFS